MFNEWTQCPWIKGRRSNNFPRLITIDRETPRPLIALAQRIGKIPP
jgi:ribosomal protein S18 acetylase RimI-like enzyme